MTSFGRTKEVLPFTLFPLTLYALLFTIYYCERAMGIEPTSNAWEALVLPLNYARVPKTTQANNFACNYDTKDSI